MLIEFKFSIKQEVKIKSGAQGIILSASVDEDEKRIYLLEIGNGRRWYREEALYSFKEHREYLKKG